MSTPTIYVSTTIPYVNAPPHLGFALEVVLADVIARHARARGAQVHFTTGTDENSLKNVRAAERVGTTTAALVEANAARYRELGRVVGASFDDFVRTSVDPRHAAAVRALWSACAARGDLEKRRYRGLYCVGCEQFWEESDLVLGRCPEHDSVPEVVEEENWFFRLSRYGAAITEALRSGALVIRPRERSNEIERFLERGLHDVSVSRSRARARGWGIEVPGDPDQVVWVWFDALANYLATLGYPEDRERTERLWIRADRRVHVLGKGVARFHAVIWPAILLAAELPLPTDLWVHGYVTVGGRKIGKSTGNAIEPGSIVATHGTDALRYFLLRHVGPTNDADVDAERIARAHDAELADGLGNLASRTLALLRRALGGAAPTHAEPGLDPIGESLAARARDLERRVDEAIGRLSPDEALRHVFDVVAAANKHLAETTPWALVSDPRAAARLRAIFHHATVALEAIGRALGPLLPATADALGRALADPGTPSAVLFPKRRARPDAA
jgi:methionyl-tRNA synthetase